jgi:16S rRNA (adenine1518-N6/adenine1519-N6)-dimethyltransferase
MPLANLPPLNVSALLRAHGLQASKGLGQNFLQDDAVLAKIAGAAEVMPQDDVLEIGPGLGSLTRHLALAARSVVAVELDDSLIPVLEQVLGPFGNTRIVRGDILKVHPADLMPSSDYLVVANIPYYITSAVFRHLLENPPRPRRIVLTIQKEVAERICARPGEMSLLALSVQVYGQPFIAERIPAGAFYPVPKVDSAVLRVDLYPQPVIPAGQLDSFFRLARAGFSQKRKTLRNSLSAGLAIRPDVAGELLARAGIDPIRRAETLSLGEWQALTAAFQSA